MLADEPTAALDSSYGQRVMDLMQSLCREAGTTMVVASHDPALDTLDQVATLQNGTIQKSLVAPQREASQPASHPLPAKAQ
ncbi:MAG: hypothetical protein R2867_03440 [Caldilineaceae bacterium]